MKIDLGYKEQKHKGGFWFRKGSEVVPLVDDSDKDEPETRTGYPDLYLSDVDPEVLDLPDEGTATIKYKVTERCDLKREGEDGKKRQISLTLEVHSITPESGKSTDPLKETARDAIDRWTRK